MKHFSKTLVATGLTALLSSTAFAAQVERVRGTIEKAEGGTLTIKTDDGKSETVDVGGAKFAWVVPSSLDAIKDGVFIGTATKGENPMTALEVVLFPEAMRGTGEGSYGWDLKPNSSMTNGSVSEAVQSVEGTTVNVVYHGQSKKIVIAPTTPIVTFAPAVNADVKPGVAVFVPADRADDGKLSTTRVVVGKDGVVPPM